MLTKPNRLTNEKDITKALRLGRRLNHAAISFVVSASNDAVSRIAVVVGTKVDKRAVVRNRLKRRTREALRPLTARLVPGFHIVAFPRLGVDTMSFGELQGVIADLFMKARLLV